MRYKINLLEKKELNLLDKLTFFCLNYLRYIIVITQLVVIGVFFYRFQIDQRIIDLKEGVEQKKEIVQIVLSDKNSQHFVNVLDKAKEKYQTEVVKQF